jgi:hypothetical protein
MEKRILIIGNTEGLPGVKVDVENYKTFFKSSYGGDWSDNEIIEKINKPKSELITSLSDLKSKSLNYLIVIFSGHGGQKRETVLELNSKGESINESDLKNIALRQLNIFDCCRAYPESLTKGFLNEMKARSFSITNTRDRYEKRIMEASHQQINLYACTVGEFAHDTSKGGAYSKNLLSCASEVKDEFKLIGVAHQEASILTTNEFKDQHPEGDLLRLLTSQQLIIGIRP